MSENVSSLLYIVAGVLFIMALRGLSHPTTSRQGNLYGMVGMGLAILTTLVGHPPAGLGAWVLVLLAVLLAVEVVADKVPVVDSLNDLLQTFVRPTSGGIVFGSATTAQTAGGGTAADPGALLSAPAWVPVAVGVVVALVVHVTKTVSRPAANTLTAGAAAPVASTGRHGNGGMRTRRSAVASAVPRAPIFNATTRGPRRR